MLAAVSVGQGEGVCAGAIFCCVGFVCCLLRTPLESTLFGGFSFMFMSCAVVGCLFTRLFRYNSQDQRLSAVGFLKCSTTLSTADFSSNRSLWVWICGLIDGTQAGLLQYVE